MKTLFQANLKKPGAPTRVEHTARETAPPRVDTPATPRVEQRINEIYPRVGTHKKPGPTIPYANTTS